MYDRHCPTVFYAACETCYPSVHADLEMPYRVAMAALFKEILVRDIELYRLKQRLAANDG